MTTISVVIATYGDWGWLTISERAHASAKTEEPDQICWGHLPDGTCASTRNEGAAAATSDYLIFLDGDDELAPGYLEAMRRAIEQPGDGPRLLTPATQWIRKGTPAPPGFQTEIPLERGNWLVIGTLISRELFNEIGGFHEHPHGLEDWNLWARAVRAGATIVKVPDAVYIAHVNPQSKHRVQFRANRKGYWDAYEKARADAWG